MFDASNTSMRRSPQPPVLSVVPGTQSTLDTVNSSPPSELGTLVLPSSAVVARAPSFQHSTAVSDDNEIPGIPQVTSRFLERDKDTVVAFGDCAESPRGERSTRESSPSPLRRISTCPADASPRQRSSQRTGATWRTSTPESPTARPEPSCCGARGAYIQSRVALASDYHEERSRKVRGLVAGISGCAVAAVSAALHASAQGWLATTADAAAGLIFALAAALLLVRRRLPEQLVDLACVALTAIFCVCDLFALGWGDIWLLSLLALYGLVQCGSRSATPFAACGALCTTWLTLRFSEEAFAWGLYDAIPAADFAARCPPTGWSLAAAALVRRGAVVLLSCWFCCSHAAALRRERSGSGAAAQVAKQVAEALVQFDLAQAEALVNDAVVSRNGQASPTHYVEDGLMAAFRELLSNLRAYRPFLPEALFVAESLDRGRDSAWGSDDTAALGGAALPGQAQRTSTDRSRASSPLSAPSAGMFGATTSAGLTRPASLTLLFARGAGLRFRRGSIVRVRMSTEDNPFYKVDGGSESHMSTLSSRLAAPVFELGRAAGGIVLVQGVDHIALTWNTHRSQPRHCHGASTSGLRIAQRLGQDDVLPQCSVVITTGQVLAGTSGTREHLATVVSGPAMELGAALALLCPRIRASCVCDDPTWELLRGDFVGRIVDAVRMSVLDKDIYVYEVLHEYRGSDRPESLAGLEHVTDVEAMRRFASAFAALRQLNYAAAKAHLTMQLRQYPTDVQAERLLNITCLLKRKNARDSLGLSNWDCYVRLLGTWFDFEARAEAQAASPRIPEVLELDNPHPMGSPLTNSNSSRHSSVTVRSSLGGGSRHGTPRHVHAGSERSASSGGSADTDDQMLRKAILDGINKGADTGLSKEDEVPRELLDQRGRRWIRGCGALGKGAFGNVYLGMGHDGGLVALKQIELPRSLKSRSRRSTKASANFSPRHRPLLDAASAGTIGDPDHVLFPFRTPTDETEYYSPRNTTALETLEGLLNEVAVMDALRHDNIVSYLGSTLAGNHVVIVLEYVPGGSLSGVLQHFEGKLPETAVRRYLIDVLKGLAFLHAHDVIHRDIKPANVLVTAEGNGKLADFGACGELSKLAGGASAVIGTPQYMSPEAGAGQAAPASDVWAVGIMAAELLTGKLPWGFTAPPQMFIRKVSVEGHMPTFASLHDTTLARNFCEACCRREPDARPSALVMRDHAFLIA
eukprot:TRINITY_DN97_c0_g4_i1.p1 TRINITY_DN97_c0_g4~~TRINITY_DN97_c0_g4_i1.p1  ORF type:complete len:1241 (+),score=307.32 TRINITY_DN97_c0_g4_i1:107-3724(+)